MGELTFLLSSYSGGELVMIFVAGLLVVTAILKAASYLWDKIKNYFNIKNEESNWKDSLDNKLDDISKDTNELKENIDEVKTEITDMRTAASKRVDRLKEVEKYVKNDYQREQEILDKINVITENMQGMTERLQDDARWAFKDAENYYVIHKKSIDSLTLEALESKYKHYKKYNGNSFVHDVMERLRALPLVPYGEGENIDGNRT